MSDHSSIEWTDATWSPTLGCDKVSEGCRSCYAIRTAYRQEYGFKRADYAGLTRRLPDGSLNWTGKVNLLESRLKLPLTWRKPRRIFVDSQSDLFHDDVPYEFVAAVFGVMLATPHHTYQVLTKRPERMREFMLTEGDRVWGPNRGAFCEWLAWGRNAFNGSTLVLEDLWERAHWPPRNVWLGVSVEDQCAADERIPLLLQTPAAVRWLSCEPLIGPVDLQEPWPPTAPLPGSGSVYAPWMIQQLDWVVAGGESGPKARPCDPDWVRSLRDQCQAAGVAFHFKQWGGATHAAHGRELDGRTWDEYPEPRRELAHA